ncbi:MAG: hypothetical protein NTW01_09385 [Gammaproteobacteria bacterium]|uniref:hypothetical protein n=1 Tax=Nevskia sp. TaxID=1929292 RepID=UPI003F6FA8B7|nr:hypothetical protein [Gammaproteobacteria bacterium]
MNHDEIMLLIEVLKVLKAAFDAIAVWLKLHRSEAGDEPFKAADPAPQQRDRSRPGAHPGTAGGRRGRRGAPPPS